MQRIVVSNDNNRFVLEPSGKPFVPWGFNYDRDHAGRLIEDYWHAEWAKVEEDFREMKALGANVVRIHLQTGKFLDAPDKPNKKNLDRLTDLLRLADDTGLYLDVTGLGCYRKKDVPAWYDDLDERQRWDAQATFWRAVAERCKDSPAVFCYDLMNEPVVPPAKLKPREWLEPPFFGKHYSQRITLDPGDRPRHEIARRWVGHLASAIREVDTRHLITVGLLDWSLDRSGPTTGFIPQKISDDLDFISVHLYPISGKLDEEMQTLAGFAIGKPVVIEEMFPLRCSMDELAEFIERSERHAAGWIGFYWGERPEELRQSKRGSDDRVVAWLEYFQKRSKSLAGE